MKNPRKWAMIIAIMAATACIYTIRSQKSPKAQAPHPVANDHSPGTIKGFPSSPSSPVAETAPAGNEFSSPVAPSENPSSAAQSSPTTTPLTSPSHPVAVLSDEEIKAALDEFNGWSTGYLAATPAQRAAMEAEGARLATKRRAAFKQLIRKNPRRAIESAVSRVVRQDLPKAITDLLEKPVSEKGNLNVYLGKAAPGVPIPEEGLALRYFEVGTTTYRAHVYGDLEAATSRAGTPLRGYAIDGQLAVAENAVRRLEVGERIPAGTPVKDTCPVSGETSTSVAEGEPVTGDTPVVEIAGELITLCNGSHVTVLEDDYRTYIQSNGPGGGGFFIDNYPGTAARSIGNLRCLYIRATYPDQMEQPNTEEQAYADMRDNARFYLENSYGKMTQTATVTPVLVLPQTLAWYKAKDSATGGTIDCLGLIHTDARAAAKAAGYDPGQFDCIIVRINKGPRLEGISWGGGTSVWITWNGMDVMNHEIGHSLSLNHANYWTSLDGTPYGYGDNEEYGNIFDVMGNGGGFNDHYNTSSKRFLNWLPTGYVHEPVTNGTYRLYAYDQPRLEEGKRYSLRVAKDARSYNLEYHPAAGGYLADGALAIYTGAKSLTGGGTNAGHLIDTTPDTLAGKNDSPIALGRTYSDPEADMHFTVVSKNGTVPESIDVTYNKGPFPGNVAPTATLAASATTISAGGSVTFTATASDANNDTLAYHWEFSDGEGGTNSSVYTRTFPTAAQITAMLTVSDMKGGSVRRSVVIDVGSHGKQTISGTITAGGVGLPGVYVSGNGKGCYTNADGTYSLTGITTGSQSLTATLAGYTFTPSGFTNPLNVAAGTNTANWTASASTFVTLAKIADATEGGGNGTFRLTRTGSTASALTVLVSPATGSATKNTDYTFSPDYTASGSFFTFTIPAGSATLDVTVAATNDTSAEGPETIRLQVASGSGYYSSSTNAQVMTLNDNDTSLPQVSVVATDPYATEAPAGDNSTFTFSRTGATTSSLNLAVAWSGTATNGSDYSSLSTTVTIPSGQSSTTVTLTPTNDSAIEVPETAIATISAAAGYVLDTSASTATATITDDDTPVVTVSVPDATASEAGGDTGLFLLTRTGSTAASLKVYYGVCGSAAHGTDYARLTGEVTIPAGATSAPVVITAVNDDIAEPSEAVTLLLTTFNNAYSVGTANSGTVMILDNGDTPLVNVRAGTDGTEGGSNTTFIFRSIGTGTGNISVNYTISGTATSGSDFTALSGTISVPAGGSTDTTLTVPITNDTTLEPTESVILTITPSANYRVYNDGVAEGIIFDNDSGDRVMVSKFNQNPAETGTTGAFYISRTGTTGDLTVNYAMSGTATNGSDYNTLSGSVVIPSGSTGVDLTMTPINDTAAEGTETVTLTILSGTGYGVDIPSSATYTITDNETPNRTVGFQSATFSTNELPGIQGQFRDIPVVLSASSTNTITVDYYAGGGNAAGDNEDWAFVDAANGNAMIREGTLTFAPGTTTQNIRIRVNNDGVGEANETAIIQLARAYNAALGTATNTITITDSAGPQSIRMITTASTRSEADGSEPLLQAILDRPAESAISVSYSASGTATSGSDYTLTGTSLSFAVGEQIKPIPLTLLTDATIEAPETITISLSNPVGADLTAPAAHTITVTDASAPQVASQFVSAASSQSAGTLITTAAASLSSGRTVSNWTILSGNTGNLFTLNSTNGQLTLTTPASLPNPGGVQLIVRVTDNAGASGTGAINIICNAPANAVVERRWTGTSAYFAEDWSQTSSYSGSLATLTSGTNVSNNYSRRLTGYLKPQTSGDYTFWIAGDDECRLYLSTDGYEARKVQIASVVGATSFQAWDTYDSQKSATIPLVAGKVYWIEAQQVDNSGNDSVSVAWAGPSITRVPIPASVMVATAPGLSFPLPESGIGTNTAPTISDVTDRSTDAGTSTGAIAFTVGDAETAAGALIVSASSSNLTLLPQSNIVLGGGGANRTVTLTPAQGQVGNATVTLTVTDGLKSATDTFLLAVGSSQIVAFQNATGSGSEATSPASIQVTMSSAKASPVTVDYAVTGGTATSGSDYTLTNGTLTFAPGETSKTISMPVVNDTSGEVDETVEISLGNAIGAVIGTNVTHTYTIINEDTDFSIVATDANAAETASDPGTFTITRAGLSAASVTVNLTRGGTATNSSDYTSIPSTITFAAGETVKTITVTPVDDLIVEGSETMTLTIAPGTGYAVGSPSSDTVTIADNDVDISITASTPNTAEGGAAGVFTVTRTGITTGSTVVNLTIGGTAVPTTDYTAIAATLTFTAGQTSKTINVSPVNDTAYEDSETVTLTVSPGTGYQPAAPTSATVTIADNDKPTISVAGTVTAASETGPVNGLLTFTRTGWTGIAQDISLTITGTAVSGADYVALPATITFPANSDTTTLTVTPINDADFEVAETVIVTIAANAAYTVAGSPNNASTVTIADNDKPTVTVAATDASAAESGTANPGVFTLTRTGTTAATLVVNYSLGGTAINGTDYTSLTGTVTFAANSATATVTVTVTNDTDYEDTETVDLTISADPAYLVGSPSSASLSVADNDKPTISVTGTTTAASETGPANGLLTFTRTGWTGIAQDVTLTITGTATSATDYTALPMTITFPANSATTTLSVIPIDDADFEVAETVIVTIATNAAYTVAGSPNNAATVTIADNDKPTVTVAATDTNCLEANSDNGVFTLTRTGTTAASLTVNYTLGGAATNGTDYVSLTGSVTFAAAASTATVTIDPIDDAEYEIPEDATITLSADAAYLIGSPNAATLTISDNDKPTVSVVSSISSVIEGGTVPVLTFSRSGTTSLGALTVVYAVSGTATVGADYAAFTGSITIPQNQASATVPAGIIQDNVTEAPETLIITISTNAAYNIAAAPSNAANLTILDDNEAVAVNISSADTSASEPAKGDGTGTFTITRSGSTTATLTVNLSITGTATNGADFSTIPTTVTIPSGQTATTVTITPTDDAEAEVDETVVLNLLVGTGYSVGATSSVTVNLFDDEATQVRVELTDGLSTEATTVGTGSFTLRRLGNRTAALTVNVTTSGTATSGSDYTALTATYAIGANSGSTIVTVTPINDALVEGTETVILTVATGTGYTVNAQNSATLEIRDDETVDVTLTAQDSTCAEQATPDTGTFRITRSATATTALAVSYTITGTATNGTDYTSLTGTATIPANATTVDIILTPTNDGILEGSESVIMTLTGGGATYDVGDTRTQTIWIKDDDTPSITLAATDAAAAEADGGTADQGLWTFTSSFAPTSNLTINYTVSTNNGIDCTYLPGSIVLPAGQTTVTLPLVPIDDELVEAAENVGVTLAYGGNYNLTTTAAVNVVIAASDTPVATVSAFDPNATENPVKTGRFVVTFNKVVSGNTNVTYTVGGTATATSDYTALTGTVTVNNGANSAIITVTPVDDALSEGPETVSVTLTASVSYSIGSPSSATVTIADDELVPAMTTWKQTNFTTDWNNDTIAGDSVDYDNDGASNLLEYALGTDPKTSTSGASLSQSGIVSGYLSLSFTRVLANNDITITVQGADSLSGPWTDLASSVNGAAMSALIGGVSVSETGTGATRTVSVSDLYATTDPAHPRRFMRVLVTH